MELALKQIFDTLRQDNEMDGDQSVWYPYVAISAFEIYNNQLRSLMTSQSSLSPDTPTRPPLSKSSNHQRHGFAPAPIQFVEPNAKTGKGPRFQGLEHLMTDQLETAVSGLQEITSRKIVAPMIDNPNSSRSHVIAAFTLFYRNSSKHRRSRAITNEDDESENPWAEAVDAPESSSDSEASFDVTRLAVPATLDDVKLPDSNQKVEMRTVYFIDLAGSEQIETSDVLPPQRLIESGAINRSLSALTTCINQIHTTMGHVAFRTSPLTRVLQQALAPSVLQPPKGSSNRLPNQPQFNLPRLALIITCAPEKQLLRQTISSVRVGHKLGTLPFRTTVRSYLQHQDASQAHSPANEAHTDESNTETDVQLESNATSIRASQDQCYATQVSFHEAMPAQVSTAEMPDNALIQELLETIKRQAAYIDALHLILQTIAYVPLPLPHNAHQLGSPLENLVHVQHAADHQASKEIDSLPSSPLIDAPLALTTSKAESFPEDEADDEFPLKQSDMLDLSCESAQAFKSNTLDDILPTLRASLKETTNRSVEGESAGSQEVTGVKLVPLKPIYRLSTPEGTVYSGRTYTRLASIASLRSPSQIMRSRALASARGPSLPQPVSAPWPFRCSQTPLRGQSVTLYVYRALGHELPENLLAQYQAASIASPVHQKKERALLKHERQGNGSSSKTDDTIDILMTLLRAFQSQLDLTVEENSKLKMTLLQHAIELQQLKQEVSELEPIMQTPAQTEMPTHVGGQLDMPDNAGEAESTEVEQVDPTALAWDAHRSIPTGAPETMRSHSQQTVSLFLPISDDETEGIPPGPEPVQAEEPQRVLEDEASALVAVYGTLQDATGRAEPHLCDVEQQPHHFTASPQSPKPLRVEEQGGIEDVRLDDLLIEASSTISTQPPSYYISGKRKVDADDQQNRGPQVDELPPLNCDRDEVPAEAACSTTMETSSECEYSPRKGFPSPLSSPAQHHRTRRSLYTPLSEPYVANVGKRAGCDSPFVGISLGQSSPNKRSRDNGKSGRSQPRRGQLKRGKSISIRSLRRDPTTPSGATRPRLAQARMVTSTPQLFQRKLRSQASCQSPDAISEFDKPTSELPLRRSESSTEALQARHEDAYMDKAPTPTATKVTQSFVNLDAAASEHNPSLHHGLQQEAASMAPSMTATTVSRSKKSFQVPADAFVPAFFYRAQLYTAAQQAAITARPQSDSSSTSSSVARASQSSPVLQPLHTEMDESPKVEGSCRLVLINASHSPNLLPKPQAPPEIHGIPQSGPGTTAAFHDRHVRYQHSTSKDTCPDLPQQAQSSTLSAAHDPKSAHERPNLATCSPDLSPALQAQLDQDPHPTQHIHPILHLHPRPHHLLSHSHFICHDHQANLPHTEPLQSHATAQHHIPHVYIHQQGWIPASDETVKYSMHNQPSSPLDSKNCTHSSTGSTTGLCPSLSCPSPPMQPMILHLHFHSNSLAPFATAPREPSSTSSHASTPHVVPISLSISTPQMNSCVHI